ncbi:MAG TPA: aliphatic sulfonate ABC transporter substrate-binding protein [bacterium]|nr:aliphatic sulfonate ABC transporter substrate-binding protein [bacterium]
MNIRSLAIFLLSAASLGATDLGTVRIGYQPSSSVLLVGKAKGFYEKELAKLGKKVEWLPFLSGPVMVEAAAGDRVDLLGIGNMPPLVARAGGIDLKVIAKAAFNPATNALLVRPDSPIHSVADLKGKKVAAQVGSSLHFFLGQLLARAGLTLKDVRLVNLAGPDQGPALQSGAVDAILLWMPYRTQLERAGKARVVADSAHVPGGYSFYAVRNAFGRKDPEVVRAFLRATRETNRYMKGHPRKTLEFLARESRFPAEDLKPSLRGYDWSLRIEPEDIRAMGAIKDYLLASKVIRKDFPIGELFDLGYEKGMGK